MRKRHKSPVFILFIALAVILPACQSYQSRVIPAKLPSAYPNATEVAGATLAAKLYDDKKEAEALYGFDIVGAGVIPVQVVIDNTGAHPLQIVPDQTLLVDEESNIWPLLEASLAYERISKKTQFGEIAPEAAKGGVLAGLAGAVIGAAIGVVTGTNVGNAAGMGAAVGAAAGSVIVVLMWIYYASLILLFGAEFTQVYARQTGSGIVLAKYGVAVTQEERGEQGMSPRKASGKTGETPARQPVGTN